MIAPRLLLPLAFALLAPCLPAPADPGPAAYPFSCVVDQADLLTRAMTGGCWLAGLPGYPRYNGTHVHAGVDFRATLGEPIFAIMDGLVDPASDIPHSGYGPGWTIGQCIIVRSEGPVRVGPDVPDGPGASGTSAPTRLLLLIYGHTQNHRVIGGQVVKAGEMLAEVGPWLDTEGGPHLHVTMRLGELPRYGWGTPTLAGNPVREGAEVVACEADVLRLGYRNPLLLWK